MARVQTDKRRKPPCQHDFSADPDRCSGCGHTRKKIETLKAGRAALAAKRSTSKARKAGADMVTGNPPPVPDVGTRGPKIVDTPYPDTKLDKRPTKRGKAADQHATKPDKGDALVDDDDPTNLDKPRDKPAGRQGSSGLVKALKIAMGLD